MSIDSSLQSAQALGHADTRKYGGPAMTHPYLLGAGGLLMVLGLLLMRWASRHDLKGLAIDAAWEMAKNRRLNVETDLGNR
jgi:hypothetical protein